MGENAAADHTADAARELYGVDPGSFVAERTRLAKDARGSGDRALAEAIGALRKPTVSAWAVNRLARDEPDGMDELVAANERLRDAMSATGRQAGEGFRRSSEERQRVVNRLTDRAESILQDAGLSASRANLDRVATTLLATATDEAAADLVRSGVLDHDLATTGFGDLFGGIEPAPAPPPAEEKKASPRSNGGGTPSRARRAAPAPEDAAARKRRERAEREAEDLDARAKKAERSAELAEDEAKQSEREAEAAVKAASNKRREADRARKEAVRARERARTAVDRLTGA
jgi:hypothetical protein